MRKLKKDPEQRNQSAGANPQKSEGGKLFRDGWTPSYDRYISRTWPILCTLVQLGSRELKLPAALTPALDASSCYIHRPLWGAFGRLALDAGPKWLQRESCLFARFVISTRCGNDQQMGSPAEFP